MNNSITTFSREKIEVSFSRVLYILSFLILAACNNSKQPPASQITSSPEEFHEKTSDLIKRYLEYAISNNGKIDDSIQLSMSSVIKMIYENIGYKTAWEQQEQWQFPGIAFYKWIENAKLFGLFPEDYYYNQLAFINSRFENDSLGNGDRRDAALWARSDLMMTNAFIKIVKDLKLGRLPQDSVTLRRDSVLKDDFYWQQFLRVQTKNSVSELVSDLEPKNKGYHQLKAGIKKFLDNADYKEYTRVSSPKDFSFKTTLQRRLFEGGFIAFDSTGADSLQLAEAIRKFQKHAGINVDGRAGDITIRLLNTSDKERFVRIAITLDRYKMLPEKMPDRYLWVNLPGYYLRLVENDSDKLYSKIICGKASTRSPVLTSTISELITYPQWTIPQSIIVREILPAAKKNPAYISKKGFSLIDAKGNVVNPDSVNWSKYSRGIPYRVIQGSGDDNALGVMKFNFSNKYAVYLHDTNQRYLFSIADRALSHGCIRVENWKELASNIIRDEGPGGVSKEDSVIKWLNNKEKHSISVRNRLPLYIRYFTCEGKNDHITFYDDIYGEDKKLSEKYFAGK